MRVILVVLNYTPVVRRVIGWEFRVAAIGANCSTATRNYGGSGVGNGGSARARAVPSHARDFSLDLVLPPLGALFLKPA